MGNTIPPNQQIPAVASQQNLDFLKQFISPFINGNNINAIIGTFGDQDARLDQLSIAVTSQMTISTSSGSYLDRNLANQGMLARPSSLGMEDLSYQNLGIQVDANKQITSVIMTVLATFYGEDAVRAWGQSGVAEPYALTDGMDFIFNLEDGKQQQMFFHAEDFVDIEQATAAEVAAVITQFIENAGYNGFALPYFDVNTGFTYVRIYGGARGPYSMVMVDGGQAQTVLQFPYIRATDLPANDTTWQITRTHGQTIRFRWSGSGSRPLLENIFVGDIALIYGHQFASLGIEGSFLVTGVQPSGPVASYDSGWFEITVPIFASLTATPANVDPPINQPASAWNAGVTYPQAVIVLYQNNYYESLQAGNLGNAPSTSPLFWGLTAATGIYYSYIATQAEFTDLMFTLGEKNVPYEQPRYALAWEPDADLLKIYMPASTQVVKRSLIGAGHLHALYPAGNLNGTYGSATDPAQEIQIVTQYSIRYPQDGLDLEAVGGTLTYGATTVPINYVARYGGYTLVVTTKPHGITGTADSYGRIFSTTIVTINAGAQNVDDPINHFNGPYLVDPTADYTLSPTEVFSEQAVPPAIGQKELIVLGGIPNAPGFLLFDLNKPTQEGPVPYFGSQLDSSATVVPIVTISQNGTTVTVTTSEPHNAIPLKSSVMISGTVNFNGTYLVQAVPSDTSYTFNKAPPITVAESTGVSSTLVTTTISTLFMDPAYNFKYAHEVGADVTLLEQNVAYKPAPNGSDYGCYATGTADGLIFAQKIINAIVASGINLEIVIVYPSDSGWGNAGDGPGPAIPESDEVHIYGSSS